MDEIEIIKGNDGGSYFWIMPAKTLASSKKYDFYDNTEKMFSEDISIEEDAILDFLSK